MVGQRMPVLEQYAAQSAEVVFRMTSSGVILYGSPEDKVFGLLCDEALS